MKRRGLLLFLVLFPCVVNAEFDKDGRPADSTSLDPADVKIGKRNGYVLSSGSATFYCRGGRGPGCTAVVSYERCPSGLNPSVVSAVVNGSLGADSINAIYLQPQPGQLIAWGQGYALRFLYAFIQPAMGLSSPASVGINYSVYCS